MTRAGGLTLAATAAGLGLIVMVEWIAGLADLGRVAPPTRPAHPQHHATGPASEVGAPPEMIDDWVRTSLARPLMTSSRRPAPSAEDNGVAISGGLPRLAGTIMTQGDATAIFARDDNGRALILHQGGSMGPYRVTAITADSVTITGPDGAQTLHPRFGEAKTFGYQPGPYQPGYQPGPVMPGPMGMQPVPGVMQPVPGLPQPQLDHDSE